MANRTVSVSMTLSDLERRNARNPFSGESQCVSSANSARCAFGEGFVSRE